MAEAPKRTIAVRKHHSEEVWALVRRDDLGGATASACSRHYGVSVDALRRREFASLWDEIAHEAQRVPQGVWGAK